MSAHLSVRLPALPRMADFAAFAEVVGWTADTVPYDDDESRREGTPSQRIELRCILPELRIHGINVESTRGSDSRIITIRGDRVDPVQNHDMRIDV